MYVVFGFTNGIFFTPPSELVIWLAIRDGTIGTSFHLFILANSAGHFILFWLAGRHKALLSGLVCHLASLILRRDFSTHYRNSIDWLHEESGWYMFYGRLLPFFHTFTSIVAGFHNEKPMKLLLFTILGNYMFGVLIFVHFVFLSKILNQFSYLLVLFLTFVIVHILIKRRMRYLQTLDKQA
jgi:membrane protein DedA with SNARE-associated domain